MSIALKKRPSGGVPTPSPMHLTFFVDQNGNPSLKDSAGVVTPATNAGGPLQINEQPAPPDPVTNAVKLYAQDDFGRAELYARDDAGAEVAITQSGHVSNNYNIRWNGSTGNLFDSSDTVPTLEDVVWTLIDPTTTLSGEGDKEGKVVTAGDRVLRACAVSPTEDQVANGIYIVAAGDWTRATDADTGAKIQDAIVEFVYLPGPPSYAVRVALWNPSGVPLEVDVDPQNWVFTFAVPPISDFDVVVVSTSNITLSGLANVVDDYTLNTPGERVLVAGQINSIDNGVYQVAAGAWERDGDFATGMVTSGGVIAGITSGTLYSGRQFILNASLYRSILIGTDPQNWILFLADNLASYGPVRVDVDFYDMVMGRSYPPYATPTNGLVVLTMPPITPESAGKDIAFVEYDSTQVKKYLDNPRLEYVVVVQPAGTDTVSAGLAPGELALILAESHPIIRLISDGVGTWIIDGIAAAYQAVPPYIPTPPTPGPI